MCFYLKLVDNEIYVDNKFVDSSFASKIITYDYNLNDGHTSNNIYLQNTPTVRSTFFSFSNNYPIYYNTEQLQE